MDQARAATQPEGVPRARRFAASFVPRSKGDSFLWCGDCREWGDFVRGNGRLANARNAKENLVPKGIAESNHLYAVGDLDFPVSGARTIARG